VELKDLFDNKLESMSLNGMYSLSLIITYTLHHIHTFPTHNNLSTPEAPLYIAQLGDLLDGKNHETNTSHSALASALSHLNRAPCPTVNLIGNHELYNFNRPYLSKAPWLRHGDTEYYSFSPAPGWRTIVLDPYQIALIGHVANDPRRNEAVDTIQTMNPNVDPNGIDGDWFVGMEDAGARKRFVPYNGGLGTEQLEWLRRDLASAVEEGEKVVIMSHVILHPMACGGYTMVWDYEEALEVIASDDAGDCVVAVLAGHDHKGGYHCDEYGVHHCTFASPLNKGEDGFAFGLVHIGSNDCIEIRGPKIDDLLPCKNGRPSSNTMMVGDSISGPCEFIRLPLREGTSNRDGWLRTVL